MRQSLKKKIRNASRCRAPTGNEGATSELGIDFLSAALSRDRLNHRLTHHCHVEVWSRAVGGTEQQLGEAGKPASVLREVIAGEVGSMPTSLKAQAAQRRDSLLV